ncbi:MAG: DUF4340 domain-containing protein [Bacteroidota bacterium]
MFRRFTNQQLGIALGVLVLFYGMSVLLGENKDRSFKKTLGLADTTAVNKIEVVLADNEVISVERTEEKWTVNGPDGTAYPADEEQVKRSISSLLNLEATQLVASKEENWGAYEVDTAGTQVRIYKGTEKLTDLVLGRFEYKQAGMMNYVREGENEEVYLVKGFLTSAFSKEVEGWRNKNLISEGSEEWLQLTFNYPEDSSFSITKSGENWLFPDSTVADAGKVRSYLSTLGNLKGQKFVVGFLSSTVPVTFSLRIEGPSTPIQINAYPDDTHEYVLASSQNPDAFFSGKEGELWKKVFVGAGKVMVGKIDINSRP